MDVLSDGRVLFVGCDGGAAPGLDRGWISLTGISYCAAVPCTSVGVAHSDVLETWSSVFEASLYPDPPAAPPTSGRASVPAVQHASSGHGGPGWTVFPDNSPLAAPKGHSDPLNRLP